MSVMELQNEEFGLGSHVNMVTGRTGSPRHQDKDEDNPYRLHKTRLSVENVESLVSRLTKTNTTTAKKAVLWSTPRLEYEYNFISSAIFKRPSYFHDRYDRIAKHYPGTWRVADPEERSTIVSRLTSPTASQLARTRDIINRRQVIEGHRKRMLDLDIGVSKEKKERILSARPLSSAPPARTEQEEERDNQKYARAQSARAPPKHSNDDF